VYLSSDLARYVTGAVIPVTGGAEIPASQIPTITNPLVTA
jgi:hypothetical protein